MALVVDDGGGKIGDQCRATGSMQGGCRLLETRFGKEAWRNVKESERHFNVRGEFRERILIDLKLRVHYLEAYEGNLLPKLIGDLAGTLKVTTEPL
ncbi:hypothetical protein BHM03_00033642 [Ensete ventricosum]|nr:hypothetical protein BHM03_00033642 [Ensete ventricosum]